MRNAWITAALAIALAPSSAGAQEIVSRFAPAEEVPVRQAAVIQDRPAPVLRYAKWGALGITVGTAGIGLVAHRDADLRYRELEEICIAEPERCEDRLPSGAFADPALEGLYRDVVDLDSRARTSLLVSQIGVVATVALFILDLKGDSEPTNIPYDPPGLRVGLAPNPGAAVSVGVWLPYPVSKSRTRSP